MLINVTKSSHKAPFLSLEFTICVGAFFFRLFGVNFLASFHSL